MAIIAIRTVIIYAVVLFAIRVMGKSELSKLSPFQLVITFMIAELAAIPIESSAIPLLSGITAIAVLVFLQVLISFISIKNEAFKNFINGKPSLLIDHGKINVNELLTLRMSINDLLEQLRLANAPSIVDVDYAIMEGNGNLSVIQKSSGGDALPVLLYASGVLYLKNLQKIGLTPEALDKFLKTYGLSLAVLCKNDMKSKDGSKKNKKMNRHKTKHTGDAFIIFSDEKRNYHIYSIDKNGYAKDITAPAAQ